MDQVETKWFQRNNSCCPGRHRSEGPGLALRFAEAGNKKSLAARVMEWKILGWFCQGETVLTAADATE
jgi:hypothetical protein